MISAPGSNKSPVSSGEMSWISCRKIGISIIPEKSAMLFTPIMIADNLYIGNVYTLKLSIGFSILVCLITYIRSEEHTSELQSRFDLVCRLLLEKKKKLIF